MLARVRLRGDVRRVQGTGRDLVVRSRHLVAGRIGQRLRRRGQHRLPGFPRIGRARMACVGLHLALLRDVHIVIVGAGGPGFPCLVHVPETERHGLGRVVTLRELFGRGTGRAVQSGPMQGDGARHVLADRTVATARGDRVGHVAGRAGLGERAAGLRADGQIIVRRGGLVLVERDDHDTGRGTHVLLHELVHARGRIVAEAIPGVVRLGSSVVVSIRRDVLVPVVLPHALVIDAGPVPYAGRRTVAGDRAHGHDAAVAVALARMALVETGDAPAVRVGQRGGGLAGRVVHPHARVGHGAAHAVDVGRRPPRAGRGVLVLPELHCRAAAAGAGPVAALAAGVRGAGGQSAGQCRRGDEQGQRLPLVVIGTQSSFSFRRFCLQIRFPPMRAGNGTARERAFPCRPSNRFHMHAIR